MLIYHILHVKMAQGAAIVEGPLVKYVLCFIFWLSFVVYNV